MTIVVANIQMTKYTFVDMLNKLVDMYELYTIYSTNNGYCRCYNINELDYIESKDYYKYNLSILSNSNGNLEILLDCGLNDIYDALWDQ